eukprot:c25191_g6_i1 orf=48-431(+)
MDSHSLESLGRAFAEQYYAHFDTNRGSVVEAFYDDASCLTFEGQQMVGISAIAKKLTSLSFPHCKHYISTIDCQASGPAGGLLVFVSGSMQLPDEQYLLRFSQLFHLKPTLQGNFRIFNDIFRLNYA